MGGETLNLDFEQTLATWIKLIANGPSVTWVKNSFDPIKYPCIKLHSVNFDIKKTGQYRREGENKYTEYRCNILVALDMYSSSPDSFPRLSEIHESMHSVSKTEGLKSLVIADVGSIEDRTHTITAKKNHTRYGFDFKAIYTYTKQEIVPRIDLIELKGGLSI